MLPKKCCYEKKAGQGRRHHDPSDGAGVRRIAETPLSSCQPEGEEANPGRVLRDDENAPEVGDQAAQRGARPEGRGAGRTAGRRGRNRAGGPRQPRLNRLRSSGLKAEVPLRTWSEWKDVPVGSVQADLVLHCGDSTEGFYLTTLCAIDGAAGGGGLPAPRGGGRGGSR